MNARHHSCELSTPIASGHGAASVTAAHVTADDDSVEWVEDNSPLTGTPIPSGPSPDRVGGWNEVLARFFQEQNIRWMLVLGAITVLGSTLMLVSREWSQWSPGLKCITVMAYTLTSGLCAQIAGARLGLRATCRVLQALTVFLCPTCFLSLNWLSAGSASQGVWFSASYLGLLIIAVAIMLYFVRPIFRSWLLREQPVFLSSYCLLCLAGAVPQVTSPFFGGMFVITLWTMMTAGVIKVNRHVFWLTESHQRPKVFGFFPILLLSLQFISVASLNTWQVLPLEWLGTVAVLQSFTILMTARAVAAAYRQRTGGLIHPLPWAIVLPIVIGMSILLGGVALSFHGFSWTGSTTYAAVPTTILAAGLLWNAASDLRNRPLAWIALIMTAIAYQNIPSLCPELIRALRGEVAAAIHQSRLPLSFYGITYLPLLLTLAAVARQCLRSGRPDLAAPIRQFVVAVGSAWCCLALVNPASAFWVSLSYSVAWLILAVVLSDRRLVAPGLLSAVGSAVGLGRFAVSIGEASSSAPVIISALSILSILWTCIPLLDRWQSSLRLPSGWFNRLFADESGQPRRLFLITGQLVASAVFMFWLTEVFRTSHQPWATPQLIEWGLVSFMFAMQLLRVRSYLAGIQFWFVCSLGAVIEFLSHGISLQTIANTASLTAGLMTCAGYLMVGLFADREETWSDIRRRLGFRASLLKSTDAQWEKDGLSRLAGVCVVPLIDLSLGVLACLAVFFHLPELLMQNFLPIKPSISFSTLVLPLWLLLATAFFRHRSLTFLVGVLIPLIVYAAITAYIGHDLSATGHALSWVGGTAFSSLVCRLLSPRNSWALRYSTLGWALLIFGGCLLEISLQARLASIGALVVIGTLQCSWSNPLRNTVLLIGGEIQALLWLAGVAGLHGFLPMIVAMPQLPKALVWCLPGMAACSLIPWKMSSWFHAKSLLVWSVIVQTLTLILLPFGLLCADEFVPGWQLIVLTAAFLTTHWIRDSILNHRAWTAWQACLLSGGVIFWLACIDVIQLTTIPVMWSLLAMSALLTGAGARLRGRRNLAILSNPLVSSGRILPFVVAIAALASTAAQVAGLPPAGQETAVLRIGTAFSCAAVYYLGWLNTRSSRDLLLAVITLNLAFVTGSLVARLTDIQFYLVPLGASILAVVQLMRHEIPAGMRDACRYIGAFLILCSPLLGVTDGSWWHVVSLMVLSLTVALVGIGLRLRTLTFSGTAFLVADLLWMLIRTSIDHPGFLWVSGVVVGAAVIALAAYCENHRERLLGRIRVLTAELATWK